MTVYIYGLQDCQTEQYAYVGSTIHPRRRWWEYRRGYVHNRRLSLWLKTHQTMMHILEHTTAEQRDMIEIAWIDRLLRDGHPLVNTQWVSVRQCLICGHPWRGVVDHRNRGLLCHRTPVMHNNSTPY